MAEYLPRACYGAQRPFHLEGSPLGLSQLLAPKVQPLRSPLGPLPRPPLQPQSWGTQPSQLLCSQGRGQPLDLQALEPGPQPGHPHHQEPAQHRPAPRELPQGGALGRWEVGRRPALEGQRGWVLVAASLLSWEESLLAALAIREGAPQGPPTGGRWPGQGAPQGPGWRCCSDGGPAVGEVKDTGSAPGQTEP